jgi:hypothetical protein
MTKEIAYTLLGGLTAIIAINSLDMYFGSASPKDVFNHVWVIGVAVAVIVVRNKFVEQPCWYRYIVTVGVVTPFWVIVYLFGTRDFPVELFLILAGTTALVGTMRPRRRTGAG